MQKWLLAGSAGGSLAMKEAERLFPNVFSEDA